MFAHLLTSTLFFNRITLILHWKNWDNSHCGLISAVVVARETRNSKKGE